MSNHPSCSPGQTDLTSSFRAANRGRTGRVGGAKEEVANNFPISYLQENDDGWPRLSEACPGCEPLRIPGHAALCPGHPAENSGSYYSPIPKYCDSALFSDAPVSSLALGGRHSGVCLLQFNTTGLHPSPGCQWLSA